MRRTAVALAVLAVATVIPVATAGASGHTAQSSDAASRYALTPAGKDAAELLPSDWPPLAEMRAGYANAHHHPLLAGDVLEHRRPFQSLLDGKGVLSSGTAVDQEYGWVDLNDDGLEEVFLKIVTGGLCGSMGCETLVLEHAGSGWQEIGNLSLDGLRLGPPVRDGYRTIYAHDACAVWLDDRYRTTWDDRQDGDWVHPHACGKNYAPSTADALHACPDCHPKTD